MSDRRSMSIGPLALGVSVLLGALWIGETASQDLDGLTSRARHLMGTRLTITLPRAVAAPVFELAFDEVARLEDVMSNWKETSEISNLNRSAVRSSFRCSTDLFDLVQASLDWAERTQGAFDPTVEPVIRRLGLRTVDGWLPENPRPWREGQADPMSDGRAPAEEGPAVIGWRHVHLNHAKRTVWFDAAGVGIDLGGIGKGAALDAAARVLARHGAAPALLDFGGQILAIGSQPHEDGWSVGIADPDDRERSALTVVARDVSLSTSGNSERGVSGTGARVGHIIDPKRGEPARFRGSVTVMAPDATSADALSTALFVMGPERGIEWADERGVEALFLWHDRGGALHRRATRGFGVLPDGGTGHVAETTRRD
jgi:FAD:protein FMN transferase